MQKKIEITIELTPDTEVGGYVAYCPELDVTTEGEDIEEAVSMMKEAAEAYVEVIGLENIPYFADKNRLIKKVELIVNA